MAKGTKQNIALTAFLTALVCVGFSYKRPQPTPTPKPEIVFPENENIVLNCANCTKAEEQKLPKVQKLLNVVIRSKCFSDRFTLTKYRSDLIQTNGLTRQQVVDKLKTDKVVAPLFYYYPKWYQSKNVIGYTNAGDPNIYLNRYFREDNTWTLCSEASNEAHEASHKMGFVHDFNRTPTRPYSVPYTVNFAFDECCDDILKTIKF